MRSIRRLLAATAAGVAMAAASIAVAGPAAASPEDGEGCVGTPSVSASYVCVISLTPENATPTVTTTPIPVVVPEVCYYLDCTEPRTVNVPVPGVGVNNGDVAVLWYKGVYYPIGIGVAGTIVPIVQDAIDLVEQEAADTVETVNDALDDAPTLDEVVDAILNNRYVRQALDAVQNILDQGACEYVADVVHDRVPKVNLNCDISQQ